MKIRRFLSLCFSALSSAQFHNYSNTSFVISTDLQQAHLSQDLDNHNSASRANTPLKPFNGTFGDDDCHAIHSVPNHQQCEFSWDHCEEYNLGLINYLGVYYCHTKMKILTLFGFLIGLVILFTTLGLTASEFLCPNLDSISKVFKMSESLTGVTLLALGNGSPDLFGTLESMRANSASLAIGELIGAALFITCCVVGSMAIVKPFVVAKRPFVRDVSFLLIGLTISVSFLHKGEIHLWMALIMIVVYIIYVFFVVLWDFFTVRQRKRELMDQKIRNSYFSTDDIMSFSSNYTPFSVGESLELNDDEILDSLKVSAGGYADSGIEFINSQLRQQSFENFQDWNTNSIKLLNPQIRPSLFSALELNNQLNAISSANGDGISLNTIKTPSAQIKLSTAPEFRDIEEGDDLRAYESRTSSSAPGIMLSTSPAYRDELDEDDVTDPGTPILRPHSYIDTPISRLDGMHAFLELKLNIVEILFPSMLNFRHVPLFNKLFLLICLPLVTILRLTVPVVDTVVIAGSKSYKKTVDLESIWTRKFPLLLLQCIASPPVTSFLIFQVSSPLATTLISVGLIGFVVFVKSSYNSNNLSLVAYFATVTLAILGFIISISWISTIATELISLIKFFSILFNLSDSILGLTVFAVGNSLGDLISNFTIAKMGFSMMAMSACFGGPLLNLLLGIGISVNYVLLTGELRIVTFEVGRTLAISCAALFINLLFLLTCVPLNNWNMDAKIGYVMIGLWGIATFVCVLLEIIG